MVNVKTVGFMAVTQLTRFAPLAVVALALNLATANAQPATGNRANGRDYQPRPDETVPREKAAGIEPPAGQQNTTDRDLERIDKDLLKSEGKSTASVPAGKQ